MPAGTVAMSGLPRTPVEVRPSAWFEGGQWYARVELYREGRAVGDPRIFRDKPLLHMRLALALAREIAASLENGSGYPTKRADS